MALKKIIYKGKTYLYEISNHMLERGTYVYDSTPIEYIERKYILFGPKVVKTKYEFLFYTYMTIDSPCYSKLDIQNKFKEELEYVDRKKEIENGNIL